MERPDPCEYQPPLRLWSHLWRVAVMLCLSAVAWLPVWKHQADVSHAWWVLDLAIGAAGYVLVFWRRRWPLTVAVVLALAGAVSGSVAGPSVLAAASVATRRRWREIALVGAVNFAAAQLFSVLTSPDDDPIWLILIANAIAVAAVLGWGMYIGSRRELIWTLRNRAERAEAEQELRVQQARGQEQTRIAREMHDVLAHRISQISMHAGALAYRDGLRPEEVRASAEVIRDKAHEALTDLRGVLGVLRDGTTGERTLTPQPTYADLAGLVDEAEESGVRIEFEDLVHDPVPEAAGRTVYRIIQEGITNVRKHAPGALLTVRVTGSPDDGIDVLLRNPVGFGPTRTPGAGLGLVGLSERAELRGGRLDHGRDGSTFVLHGWIPWAA
ncbi:sensor histidine kinase [Nocardioides sp. URHA0032]|uniref:sensor histidine kinase n=1 Tax=Nocardioides sp. URHA0032 TaxID=1380388 RepID=UPI00048F7CE4|nr:histidine kinase [Nocardioides sp. URHA0032]